MNNKDVFVWKLDDKIHSKLVDLMPHIYKESLDETNIIGFFNSVDSFWMNANSLVNDEYFKMIEEGFKLVKTRIKAIRESEEKVDPNNPLKENYELEKRREVRKLDERPIREIQLPKNEVNITALIKRLYKKITAFFKKQPTITFSQLVPSEKKQDKVLTFIPLLHLDNQNKVNIAQDTPFGEIYIQKFKDQISNPKDL